MALRDRPVLDWMIAMRTPEANALIAWFSDIGGPCRSCTPPPTVSERGLNA